MYIKNDAYLHDLESSLRELAISGRCSGCELTMASAGFPVNTLSPLVSEFPDDYPDRRPFPPGDPHAALLFGYCP